MVMQQREGGDKLAVREQQMRNAHKLGRQQRKRAQLMH
jgi:hypothetical protein